MNLAHFPGDVLAHILSPHTPSSAYIRLWKTGNRLLQHRLSSAITSVNLRPIHRYYKFPSMVSQLPRLRHFTFDTFVSKYVDQFRAILPMLPRNLQSLEVNFHSLSQFKNYHAYKPPTQNDPRYLHYLRNFDIHALFPLLLSLTLKESWSSDFNALRPDELLPGLPSTLTVLQLGDWIVDRVPFASLLPRSLVRLDCKLCYLYSDATPLECFEVDCMDAPTSLQYIKGIHLPGTSATFRWLPKSLTQLDDLAIALYGSYSLQLPVFVKKLCLLSWDTSSLSFGSVMHLTDLEFPVDQCFPLERIDCLPSALTRLKLSFCETLEELNDLKARDTNLDLLWPPGLTDLEISTITSFSGYLVTLPRSLKILTASEKLEISPSYLDDLPPLLHTLHLYSHADYIGNWPANLQSLYLSRCGRFGQCPPLPPSVTKFSMARQGALPILFTGEEPALLHCSVLTTLIFTKWSSDRLHLIPRTATDLDIHEVICPISPKKPLDHFDQLPPSLTKLRACGEKDNNQKLTSLAHLRNLTSLELVDLYIPSSDIRLLPQNMKTLKIWIEPLDSIDLVFLPLTLTECDLRLDWTTSGIADHWPPLYAGFVSCPKLREIVAERFFALDL